VAVRKRAVSAVSPTKIEGQCRLMHSNEHLPVNIGNPVEFTIRECAREVLTATRPPARWYSNPCRKMIRSSGSRTFRRR